MTEVIFKAFALLFIFIFLIEIVIPLQLCAFFKNTGVSKEPRDWRPSTTMKNVTSKLFIYLIVLYLCVGAIQGEDLKAATLAIVVFFMAIIVPINRCLMSKRR